MPGEKFLRTSYRTAFVQSRTAALPQLMHTGWESGVFVAYRTEEVPIAGTRESNWKKVISEVARLSDQLLQQ